MKNKSSYSLSLLIIFSLTIHACGQAAEKLESLHKDAAAAYIRKDLNGALSLYNQILEIEPNSIPTLIMIGKIHYYKKEFDLALKTFSEAESKDSCNAIPQFWLAKIESTKTENRHEAKERLVSIIANSPSRWEAQYALGTILEAEGKIEDALSLYNEAAAESSKLALVYLKLGKIFKKANRDKMAQQYFDRARLLSDESPGSNRLIEAEIGKDKR
ncbi:tetratricopeptide repeat protein [Leptospira sp. WS92.C1]